MLVYAKRKRGRFPCPRPACIPFFALPLSLHTSPYLCRCCVLWALLRMRRNITPLHTHSAAAPRAATDTQRQRPISSYAVPPPSHHRRDAYHPPRAPCRRPPPRPSTHLHICSLSLSQPQYQCPVCRSSHGGLPCQDQGDQRRQHTGHRPTPSSYPSRGDDAAEIKARPVQHPQPVVARLR